MRLNAYILYQGCVKPSMKVFKYNHKPFTIMLITSPSTSTNFQKVFKLVQAQALCECN